MKILLNELQEIQDRFGWLPEEQLLELAERRSLPPARLYGIVSFYSRFYTEPVEKYIIRVCKSISCGINGSEHIRQALEDCLQMTDGHSRDGQFRLEMVECLGQCGEAPVMTINDRVFSRLTPEEAVRIVTEYQQNRPLEENEVG
jgi:NADH-quinone oxidoreductase subunit E